LVYLVETRLFAVSCEHGKKPSDSIKVGEYVDQLSGC